VGLLNLRRGKERKPLRTTEKGKKRKKFPLRWMEGKGKLTHDGFLLGEKKGGSSQGGEGSWRTR